MTSALGGVSGFYEFAHLDVDLGVAFIIKGKLEHGSFILKEGDVFLLLAVAPMVILLFLFLFFVRVFL